MEIGNVTKNPALHSPHSLPAILSIVVPCFNEADSIIGTLRVISSYLEARMQPFELIVVNDGSSDQTESVVHSILPELPAVKLVSLPTHLGRGAALKAGLLSTLGDIVITMDADLSYSVAHIAETLAAFSSDYRADAVLVSAYMSGGSAVGYPLGDC